MLLNTPPRRPPIDRLATPIRLAPALLRAPVVLDPPCVLRTARLVLRPLLECDRAAYTTLLSTSRDHLARHCPLQRDGETDEQLFERHLACSRAALATGRAWRAVVCTRNHAIVGALNLNDITPDHAAEITVWIGKAHTGRGYCSEALRAALDHAYRRRPRGLGLARLTALVAPDNEASLRAFQRLGFEQDRTARIVQLNLAGRWVTHHRYVRRAPALAVALERLVATPLRSRLI